VEDFLDAERADFAVNLDVPVIGSKTKVRDRFHDRAEAVICRLLRLQFRVAAAYTTDFPQLAVGMGRVATHLGASQLVNRTNDTKGTSQIKFTQCRSLEARAVIGPQHDLIDRPQAAGDLVSQLITKLPVRTIDRVVA